MQHEFHYIVFVAIILWLPSAQASDAAKAGDICEYIRSKVVRQEAYEFGTEREFLVREEESLLLKCTENVDGIREILICPTVQHSNSLCMYIYCVRKEGMSGGGSPLERIDRSFRVTDNCAAVAEWTAEGGDIRVRLILTDDRKTLSHRLEEFSKKGRCSIYGPWQNIIDTGEFTKLTPDQRTEAFVLLWSEVKYNFANFDLVAEVDWDRVLRDTLPLARPDQSNKDFAKLLARCIAELRDGHTDVRMRFFEIFDPAQPALTVRPVEGKAIITAIGSSRDITDANLKVGDEILTIDGRSVGDILTQEIYPYIFASTEQSRESKAFMYLLRGPSNSVVNLSVKGINGEGRDLVVARDMNWERRLPRKDFANFEYKDLGGGVSYIAINTFANSDVVDKFKEHMDEVRKSRGLIIDVRENGGGNSGNGDRIVSFLIDEAIPSSPWKTPQHIAAFKAWGRPKNWYVGEAEYLEPSNEMERFAGPVVVLIGTETGSAAEDFVVLLHSSKRATLVGSKTCGSTGQPLQFEFDCGISGRICTKRNTYPDGREFIGVGIIPDVEAHATTRDIAAGRDAVLERGVAVLQDRIVEANVN
jgi:carboxyl-terminal processing protease